MQAVLWSIVLKPFIGNCHRTNSRYSHCFCILGVITKYNSHVAKQINRSGNTLLQTHTKYTPFRTERTKTIPGPAAHPRIDHYKGVSLPPPPPPGYRCIRFIHCLQWPRGIRDLTYHPNWHPDAGCWRGIRLHSLTVNRLISPKSSVIFKPFSTVLPGCKKFHETSNLVPTVISYSYPGKRLLREPRERRCETLPLSTNG